jgi:4-amino-4-deoxy-L-arabinose transferase-like glycosyltransferase
VLVLSAAHLVRVALAARVPLVEVDGAYWGSVARAFVHGDPAALSPAWPPLYPWLAAQTCRAFASAGVPHGPALVESSMRLVAGLAGTLSLVPIHWLARRVMPSRHAWWATLLAAAHPRLLQYGSSALSETTYTLCLLAALAAAAWADADDAPRAPAAAASPRARRPAPARRAHLLDAGAGAGFGLAFLARPEGLVLGLGLWLAGWIGAGRRLRPLLPAAMLAVSLPWLVVMHERLGQWSLGEKGAYNFARAHRALYERHVGPLAPLASRVNDGPELAARTPPVRSHLVRVVVAEPATVAAETLERLARLAVSSLPVAAWWPVFLLAALGAWRRREAGWRWVLLPVALALALYAPFSADRRFVVPLVPLVLIAAGSGLRAIDDWLGSRVPRAVPALVAIACAGGVAAAWLAPREEAPEHRSAGEWLGRSWVVEAGGASPSASVGARSRAVPGPIVMARKPWVAFYANGVIAELPDVPAESLLGIARAKGVRAIVADDRAAAADRPQLAAWVEGTADSAAPAALYRGAVRQKDRRWRVVLLEPRASTQREAGSSR